MIKCIDGKDRTYEEYKKYLNNLMFLYENAPSDLTDAECKELSKNGMLDEEDPEYTIKESLLEKISYYLDDEVEEQYNNFVKKETHLDIDEVWTELDESSIEELKKFNNYLYKNHLQIKKNML